MSAGAISGAGTTTAVQGAFGSLKSEDFMKVLMSELTNQDPFQPQDSSALLQQLSSLRNIESQLSLQKSIESLVNQNGLASSAGLVGKPVTGLDDSGRQIGGIVSSIRVESGKAILELDTGGSIKMANMTRILQDASAFQGSSSSAQWDIVGKDGATAPDGAVDMNDVGAWNSLLARNINRNYEPGDFSDGVVPPDMVGQTFQPSGFKDGDFNGDGRLDAEDLAQLNEVGAAVHDALIKQAAAAQ